jgi:hypothetical protein
VVDILLSEAATSANWCVTVQGSCSLSGKDVVSAVGREPGKEIVSDLSGKPLHEGFADVWV